MAACAYSAFYFPVDKLNYGFGLVAVFTIFFSSHLQIQLPRTKIHLSVSEVLIFFTLLYYGASMAVILAASEALYTSIQLRFRGTNIKNSTIALNVGLGAVSTFLTALVLKAGFNLLGPDLKYFTSKKIRLFNNHPKRTAVINEIIANR